mgnify:CR=1 FL=1
MLIFPGASAWHAAGIVERIRKAFNGNPLDADGREVPVTISVGVASLNAGMSLDTLVREADKALYRAKEKGRNRVELAASPEEEEESGPA